MHIWKRSVFVCVLFFVLCSLNVNGFLEEQVLEERYMELNEDEDIRMDEIRDDHWMVIAEESDDKKNIHALSWEVYVKYKGDLMKR